MKTQTSRKRKESAATVTSTVIFTTVFGGQGKVEHVLELKVTEFTVSA